MPKSSAESQSIRHKNTITAALFHKQIQYGELDGDFGTVQVIPSQTILTPKLINALLKLSG